MRKPEIISKSHVENLTAETLNKFFRIVCCIYNDQSIFEDAMQPKENIMLMRVDSVQIRTKRKCFLKNCLEMHI